jgi:hypothetical protein
MVLYTLVVIFYDTLSLLRRDVFNRINWQGKSKLTFSNMISSVRSSLWLELILEQVPGGAVLRKLSLTIKKVIDCGITQAA